MVTISLMASQSYLPGFVFPPELRRCGISKDCQTLWPSVGAREEFQRFNSLNLSPHDFKEPWKPVGQLLEGIHFVKIASNVQRPVLINVQDARPDSLLFSFGIAEHGARHEKILQFLSSSEGGKSELDISLMSELLGLQSLAVAVYQRTFSTSDYESYYRELGSETSCSFPPSEYFSRNFAGDLACGSKIMVHSDSEVLFTGPGAQMKDRLSIVGEFYASKNTTKWRKKPFLVPYFSRSNRSKARANMKMLEAVKVAPRESPEKINFKPSQKKKNSRKTGKERDLYRKNSFHACEILLSAIIDSRQHQRTAFSSLMKSGPEVPNLLNQFSAGLAGTGLAVLFSVACKAACGRVPVPAPKLFNTGIGVGLVWLSGAVNRLRDTIILISKGGGRRHLEEGEMARKLEKGVNEIFFRAAALMVVVVLRLA